MNAVHHQAEARRALAEATRLLHQQPPWRARRYALRLERASLLIDLTNAHRRSAASIEPPVCDSACWATVEDQRQQIANLTAALHTTRAERDQLEAELAGLRQQTHLTPIHTINGDHK